jgi:hypothetical protein
VKSVLFSVCLVGDPHVIAEATNDVHLIRCERRLHPEGTSGPTLAGKAVTHRNHKRIARNLQTKLPTVTCGLSGSHSRETYRTVGRPLVPLRAGARGTFPNAGSGDDAHSPRQSRGAGIAVDSRPSSRGLRSSTDRRPTGDHVVV